MNTDFNLVMWRVTCMIVFIGATGNIGKHVVAELNSRELPVRVVSRGTDATSIPGSIPMEGRVTYRRRTFPVI